MPYKAIGPINLARATVASARRETFPILELANLAERNNRPTHDNIPSNSSIPFKISSSSAFSSARIFFGGSCCTWL